MNYSPKLPKNGLPGLLLATAIFFQACEGNEPPPKPSGPTPLEIPIPSNFPGMVIPDDNPTTVEGVKLGRMLFYEPRLSGDNSQSCASCHAQAFSFTDNGKAFSTGIDNVEGTISAMAVVNAGWINALFWDGRAEGLEAQAGMPVENPIEMHETWPNVVAKLGTDQAYRKAFEDAFGTNEITKERATKAIAQFERTMVSGNSNFDKYQRQEPNTMGESALRGMQMFFTERGDCFHCHTVDLMTDNDFHNNGLDQVLYDGNMGRGAVTGNPFDHGKFRTPTLRNIALTAPYMHDGRFESLWEVVEHYNSGIRYTETLDPLLTRGFLGFSAQEKADMVAFLESLTDSSFISNPDFSSPW